MKELQDKIQDKAKVVDQRQVEKSVKVQSLVPKPGHRVWELDLGEKVIREAEIVRVDAKPGVMGVKVVKRVNMRPGCIYCTALNAKNADKRFMKMLAMYAIIQKGGNNG